MASIGYQLPLFEFQEGEVAVLSIQADLHHYRSVWIWVCSTLPCSSLQSQRQANHHRTPALSYWLGQLWLSAKDIQADFQKAAASCSPASHCFVCFVVNVVGLSFFTNVLNNNSIDFFAYLYRLVYFQRSEKDNLQFSFHTFSFEELKLG